MWLSTLAVLSFWTALHKSSRASATASAAVASCQDAQNECQISHTCGLQYHSVLIRCQAFPPENSNLTQTCSQDCQLALQNLERGTPQGRAFIHCDCLATTDPHDVTYCQNHNSLFSCFSSADPVPALTDTTLTRSCNNARRYCENDWICRDALHYYEVVCEEYFERLRTQLQSSARSACPWAQCQESFQILLRQTFAKPISDCRCGDGDAGVPTPQAVYCFQAAGALSECPAAAATENRAFRARNANCGQDVFLRAVITVVLTTIIFF